MKTIVSSDLNKAAETLKIGGIVVFPTETVYGIGADSRNIVSCEKIYKIKNRPVDNPFIVHLDSVKAIEQIAVIPNQFYNFINHFSPGPITYILNKKDDSIFSSGLSTVAIRVPSDPITKKFLEIAGVPVSAPSANISGKPSITRSKDAIEQFFGKVDFILTGNDSDIGVESTVIDLTNEHPILLRPGKVSYTELKNYIPDIQKFKLDPLAKPISPGLKYRHYAPECNVSLIENVQSINGENVAVIGFHSNSNVSLSIKITSNLEYMHSLYSFFIECDKKKILRAYCETPYTDEFAEVLLNRIEKAIMK